MASSVAGGGFTFDIASVGGNWFWTVRANNVQGLGQLYQVDDIITPYGKLVDAQVPLPGDVVTAMAQSISDVQAQLAPSIVLVSGTPTVYSATVTEGDAVIIIATVPFTNGGAFGSFLTATSTSDSPWLTSTPATSIGIGKNQSGQFSLGLMPTIMLASNSPYVGHVNLQSNSPQSPIPLTVNVTVLPRPQIGLSQTTITFMWSLGTSVNNSPLVVNVSNTGPIGSLLNFIAAKIQNCSPWLSFTPAAGGPLASGDSAAITFSLIPSTIPTLVGTYTETVSIVSRIASNTPQNITVQLVVTP